MTDDGGQTTDWNTVGEVLSEMLSILILVVTGVVIIRKRAKVTERLLAKMDTGTESDL